MADLKLASLFPNFQSRIHSVDSHNRFSNFNIPGFMMTMQRWRICPEGVIIILALCKITTKAIERRKEAFTLVAYFEVSSMSMIYYKPYFLE